MTTDNIWETNEENKRLPNNDYIQVTNVNERCLACVKTCVDAAHRLRTDVSFQEKVVYSICIYFLFFMMGWVKGLFGPAYIDLRTISGTDIQQGSWILTSLFIGYAAGAVLEGFLYDCINNKLMIGTCFLVLSVSVSIVPWCSHFEAMILAYLVIGLMLGIVDPGCNAEILRVWQKKGRVNVLVMNFTFSCGSVISPLVVAPFLMVQFQKEMDFTYIPLSNDSNLTSKANGMLDVVDEKNSYIYIPFSFSAGLSVISSLLFIISYFIYQKHKDNNKRSNYSSITTRHLPKTLHITMLMLIAAMMFFYNAIVEAYVAFLPTYCVKYFYWSKENAAFLVSVFFIFTLTARFLAVIFEKWINTIICIGIGFFAMLLSSVGLFVISLYNFDSLVWFFVPLFGFSSSCLIALIISMANDYISPVTGKIASFYFVAATIGSAMNPLLLGYLMEKIGVLYFSLLFLFENTFVFIFYIMFGITLNYVVKKFGKTFDTNTPHISEANEQKQSISSGTTT